MLEKYFYWDTRNDSWTKHFPIVHEQYTSLSTLFVNYLTFDNAGRHKTGFNQKWNNIDAGKTIVHR